MKLVKFIGLKIAVMLFVGSIVIGEETSSSSQETKSLETLESKYSYMIGKELGHDILQDQLPLDFEAFRKGVIDIWEKKESEMTKEEREEALKKMNQVLEDIYQKNVQKNLNREQQFLSQNMKKEGVQVTASGLQYRVIKQGTGKRPQLKDRYEIDYQAKLMNGRSFDFSNGMPRPLKVVLSRCPIAGLTEGLLMMPEGSTYELVVPSKLAYGKEGHKSIAPYEPLIIEVKSIAVHPDSED